MNVELVKSRNNNLLSCCIHRFACAAGHVGELYKHTHVITCGDTWLAPPSSISALYFEAWDLMNLHLLNPKLALWIMSPPPQCWDHRHMEHCSWFSYGPLYRRLSIGANPEVPFRHIFSVGFLYDLDWVIWLEGGVFLCACVSYWLLLGLNLSK